MILAFIIPVISFAQMQTGGNLTVFSEDGDGFYLILNGEKQNDEPQTNIKIEDLPQPYYSAKIIFADPKLAPISKPNLMLTDPDGKLMDVTYKIKKDKTKKVKLVYYSMIPVPQDFMPPSGMYVRQFGHPAPVRNMNGNGMNAPSNETFGASVNAPGVNMNISISDPYDAPANKPSNTHIQQQQQYNQQQQQYDQPQQNYQGKGCMNRWQMSQADFEAAKRTINESAFEDTKLKTAKSIVSANCVSTDQVIAICNLFTFEDNRLAFAKYAYKHTTDPKNYFKVGNVFTFSSNKDELSEFIEKE